MGRLARFSRLRDSFRQLRRVRSEGGPERVTLEGLGRPRGWVFPTSEARVGIETRSGARVELTPALPVPWPYAWGYRLARRLGLPLASTLEPEDIRVSMAVPEVIWRRLADGR